MLILKVLCQKKWNKNPDESYTSKYQKHVAIIDVNYCGLKINLVSLWGLNQIL